MIKLYHGTNKLFLEQILADGLNAHNIIEEIKAIELLKEALAIADNKNKVVTKSGITLRAICEQRVTGNGFNFRHGKTYFGAKFDYVKNFVLSYKYGSEAISMIFELVDSLFEKEQLYKKYQEFYKIISNDKCEQKVVIEISKYNMSDFKNEKGGDPMKVFEDLNNNKVADWLINAYNFELINKIKLQEIDYKIIEDF